MLWLSLSASCKHMCCGAQDVKSSVKLGQMPSYELHQVSLLNCRGYRMEHQPLPRGDCESDHTTDDELSKPQCSAQGLNAAMCNALRRAGWVPFPGGRWMSCDYTAAAAGRVCQAELATIELELQPPASALLVLKCHG